MFAEFDYNRDGNLQKREFTQFLTKVLELGRQQLSQNEIDVLWEAMDVNSTETVSMSEFGTKLERFGLKN